MRIHELAKKYDLTTDELIVLLKNAGYEVNNRMSSVDYDMLTALDRHFNWSQTPTGKKTKTKAKARAKTKTRTRAKAAVAVADEPSPTRVRVKAKLVRKRQAGDKAVVETKTTGDVAKKLEPKAKTKTKTKTKTKSKVAAKATAKTTTKVRSSVEPAADPFSVPETKTRTKAKQAPPRAAADPASPKKSTRAASAQLAVAPALQSTKGVPTPKSAVAAPVVPARKLHAKRTRKTPAEKEAQARAVRESVRRTLAKLETTRKTKRKKTKSAADGAAELPPAQIQDRSTVAMVARALDAPLDALLAFCEELGLEAASNTELDRETIELIGGELGRLVEVEAVYGETRLREDAQIDPARLVPRAPVVTVMGHVDHGKTSILDNVRKENVAAGEAGGITQHIGAYEVETSHGNITFIDTPGHEAFTAMRARGAQITDIVVLVVAADDGVMPQTIEAIDHTRAAGVPLVVAINKIDLPGANAGNVKQELMQHNVIAEEFGGDVVVVEVSAKTGQGIDKLLEMILLQAEILELKADPQTRAQGVVVEVVKEEGRGILVTSLVQQGTLRVGDVLVLGNEYAKVRSLIDHAGVRVLEAGPSMPVQVLGSNGVPVPGDPFVAVKNEREAREISERRRETMRQKELQPRKSLTLEDLFAQIEQGAVKALNLIIKGDTNGSVEALRDSVEPLEVLEIKVKIIHAGVGVVTETDVVLAQGSSAIVIAFGTGVSAKAKEIAKRNGVDIRSYDIIYEVIEDVDKAMKGMLEPEFVERILGRAEVRKLFRASRIGTIAGSMVIEGSIPRNANVRVRRDEEVIHDGKLSSLRRFQDDVREVTENFECGIGVANFDAIEEGDIIEAYVVEEKARVV